MATERLYYDQSNLLEFSATVTAAARGETGWLVRLDRTAFYPTSGGQPNDTGRLGDLPVVDVVEDSADVVHMVTSDDDLTPLVGRTVACRIDRDRRIDHTQQHTGQHILSAAFERQLDADTVSFHLGNEYVTIDLAVPALDAEAARRVERLANEIVMACRPVRAHWMSAAQVAELPLRKPPTRSEDIRIIEIEDFDFCGCGGTHVANTGEVGPIKIRRWEKIRNDTRVEFVCGWRALADYGWKNDTVNALAAGLSANEREVQAAVERVQGELTELRRSLRDALEQLLGFEAAALVAEADTVAGQPIVVAKVFADRPFEEVRWLAGRLTEEPGRIALLGLAGATAQVIFSRSPELTADMGKLIREILPLLGGRGGGNPRVAQGGGPAVDQLEAAITSAKAALAAQ